MAAAIAPDAESGALTFMATLPVRPWKRLAARLGAASAWSVAVPLLVFLVLAPLQEGKRVGLIGEAGKHQVLARF